jgi:hypothetical protein
MNQGRRLHGVAGAFAAHIAVGQLMQFRIDQGHQLVERRLIAIAPVHEQLSDFMGWRRGYGHPKLLQAGSWSHHRLCRIVTLFAETFCGASGWQKNSPGVVVLRGDCRMEN